MTTVTLVAVGDVLVNREDPRTALSGVLPLLRAADLAFGNVEGVLTDTHPVVPGAMASTVTGTRNAVGFAGLDLASLANNHTMDAGHAGLTDTVAALAAHGVTTMGAGATLEQALRPAVLQRRGMRVDVIAVTAVLQHGAEARTGRPGVAPLRAVDCYLAPYPGVTVPGVPPRVLSVLDEGDWDVVAAAVAASREAADLVVVSVHWGDHTRPWVLTDHELLCAELLAEAGAHLVLGHHQHMLRGVADVAGATVFFGLGHAVMDLPGYGAELVGLGLDPERFAATLGEYGIYPRPEQPSFPFPSLARHTVVAVVEMEPGRVRRRGVVPCLIDGSGVARPVTRADDGWSRAVEVLQRAQRVPGLAAEVVDSGWGFAGLDVLELAAAGSGR